MSTEKRGINQHFPVCVAYEYDIISETDLNKIEKEIYVLEKITENGSDPWHCDIYTTFGQHNLLQMPVFKPLRDKLLRCAYDYAISLGSRPNEIQIHDSWFNISRHSQYQENHIHPNSHISAIYYVKAPEGSAKTMFETKVKEQMWFPNQSRNHFSEQIISYLPERNKVLLFKSDTPHFTERHEIDEDRITIAVNFRLL